MAVGCFLTSAQIAYALATVAACMLTARQRRQAAVKGNSYQPTGFENDPLASCTVVGNLASSCPCQAGGKFTQFPLDRDIHLIVYLDLAFLL